MGFSNYKTSFFNLRATSRYFLFLFIFLVSAFSIPKASDNTKPRPKILILQPVNLKNGEVFPQLGDQFRDVFKEQKKWDVISANTAQETLEEYNKIFNTPCKELGCAFDVGNMLLAKYTLYSTVTIFESFYIFSLNLVDISLAKVVWSKNGEVPFKFGDTAEKALLHRLRQLVKHIGPRSIKSKDIPSKGTLAILNLSPDTYFSHILFEWLSTHAYTSGHYDLVGKSELDFLLQSLNIKTSDIKPTKETLIPLGEKLGIDYLVYSLLVHENSEYKLDLGLFDIKNKKMEPVWPYKSRNFRKLLKYEDTFFSNLTKKKLKNQGSKNNRKYAIWKKLTIPLLTAAGGACLYLSLDQHSEADKHHTEYHAANTLNEISNMPNLKRRSQTERKNGYILSVFGGAFLLSGAVVLFTF